MVGEDVVTEPGVGVDWISSYLIPGFPHLRENGGCVINTAFLCPGLPNTVKVNEAVCM